MTGRPDDGYEVAARIQARSSRRGRLLAVLAGGLVVALAGVAIGGRLNPGSDASGSTPPAAAGSGGPGATPGPTLPPAVEIRQADQTIGEIPVVVRGLGWLDPLRGVIAPQLGPAMGGWPFVLPDGSVICACLDIDVAAPAGALLVTSFDQAGHASGGRDIANWLPTDGRYGLADVVSDPDARSLIATTAIQAGTRWDLRVAVIPFDPDATIVSRTVPDIDLSMVGDPPTLDLHSYLSPDGRRLRITIERVGDDLNPVAGASRSWLVPLSGSALGPPTEIADPWADTSSQVCPQRAWATATAFVQICRSTQADESGARATFLRVDAGNGKTKEIGLTSLPSDDPEGWLVDGTDGIVYGWSATTHHLYRIDIGALTVRDRVLGQGVGEPLDPAHDPIEASPPPTEARSVRWQPLMSASQPTPSPLLGSPDGRLLYAAGFAWQAGVDSPGIASTGIWVFDAASMAVVGHWGAAANYQSLGLTPDARFVMGVGGPGTEENAAFGNHGSELALHDRTDGSVVEILRQLDLRLGGVPLLLPIEGTAG